MRYHSCAQPHKKSVLRQCLFFSFFSFFLSFLFSLQLFSFSELSSFSSSPSSFSPCSSYFPSSSPSPSSSYKVFFLSSSSFFSQHMPARFAHPTSGINEGASSLSRWTSPVAATQSTEGARLREPLPTTPPPARKGKLN